MDTLHDAHRGIRHGYASTRLGELLLVADGDAITGLYFPDHTYPPKPDAIGELVEIDVLGNDMPGNDMPGDDVLGEEVRDEELRDEGASAGTGGEYPLLAQAADELREYLAGKRRSFDVPVAASGDPLSEAVWQHLLRIPYGETTTYGEIAASLGRREFAQRVGQAVGHNPISIIIPCHRVLGADGSLTGYAGGLDRKRALLDLEEPEEARLSRLF